MVSFELVDEIRLISVFLFVLHISPSRRMYVSTGKDCGCGFRCGCSCEINSESFFLCCFQKEKGKSVEIYSLNRYFDEDRDHLFDSIVHRRCSEDMLTLKLHAHWKWKSIAVYFLPLNIRMTIPLMGIDRCYRYCNRHRLMNVMQRLHSIKDTKFQPLIGKLAFISVTEVTGIHTL